MISLFNIVKCWMGNMFPNARSAKLQIVCRLNMSKTAVLDTKLFRCTCIVYMIGGYSQGGGGSQLPRGGARAPPPPK